MSFEIIGTPITLSSDFAVKFRKAKKFRKSGANYSKYPLEWIGLMSSGYIFATDGSIAAVFKADINELMTAYKPIYYNTNSSGFIDSNCSSGFIDSNWKEQAPLLIPHQLALKDMPSEWSFGRIDGGYGLRVKQGDYEYAWKFGEFRCNYLPARNIFKTLALCNDKALELNANDCKCIADLMAGNEKKTLAIFGNNDSLVFGGWNDYWKQKGEERRLSELATIVGGSLANHCDKIDDYFFWDHIKKILKTGKKWSAYVMEENPAGYFSLTDSYRFNNGDYNIILMSKDIQNYYAEFKGLIVEKLAA